jgi:molybdopterin converting factor small subunit
VIAVRIPPTLRGEVGGARQLDAEGDTVRELLEDLTARYPALAQHVWADGDVAPFLNVYVGGEDVRTLDGLDTAVNGSPVILLPAMAGGSDSLAADASRPAEPDSGIGSRRWPQDAAPSALGRTSSYCPARLGLASFASDAPGNPNC